MFFVKGRIGVYRSKKDGQKFMERIAKENINTGSEYDRIFSEREGKQVDSQDLKRWKRLIKYYKGGLIMDIGCLDSKIVNLIANPENYKGIDIAKDCIRSMQEKNPKAFFRVADLYNIPWEKEVFDYVVLGEVLEHLEEPEKAIKEAMRILKVGGTLAVSVPLQEAREFGAVDKDRHLWSFEIEDIINMLKPYGRTRTYVMGSEYFPVYKYHWPTLLAYCKKK